MGKTGSEGKSGHRRKVKTDGFENDSPDNDTRANSDRGLAALRNHRLAGISHPGDTIESGPVTPKISEELKKAILTSVSSYKDVKGKIESSANQVKARSYFEIAKKSVKRIEEILEQPTQTDQDIEELAEDVKTIEKRVTAINTIGFTDSATKSTAETKTDKEPKSATTQDGANPTSVNKSPDRVVDTSNPEAIVALKSDLERKFNEIKTRVDGLSNAGTYSGRLDTIERKKRSIIINLDQPERTQLDDREVRFEVKSFYSLVEKLEGKLSLNTTPQGKVQTPPAPTISAAPGNQILASDSPEIIDIKNQLNNFVFDHENPSVSIEKLTKICEAVIRETGIAYAMVIINDIKNFIKLLNEAELEEVRDKLKKSIDGGVILFKHVILKLLDQNQQSSAQIVSVDPSTPTPIPVQSVPNATPVPSAVPVLQPVVSPSPRLAQPGIVHLPMAAPGPRLGQPPSVPVSAPAPGPIRPIGVVTGTKAYSVPTVDEELKNRVDFKDHERGLFVATRVAYNKAKKDHGSKLKNVAAMLGLSGFKYFSPTESARENTARELAMMESSEQHYNDAFKHHLKLELEQRARANPRETPLERLNFLLTKSKEEHERLALEIAGSKPQKEKTWMSNALALGKMALTATPKNEKLAFLVRALRITVVGGAVGGGAAFFAPMALAATTGIALATPAASVGYIGYKSIKSLVIGLGASPLISSALLKVGTKRANKKNAAREESILSNINKGGLAGISLANFDELHKQVGESQRKHAKALKIAKLSALAGTALIAGLASVSTDVAASAFNPAPQTAPGSTTATRPTQSAPTPGTRPALTQPAPAPTPQAPAPTRGTMATSGIVGERPPFDFEQSAPRPSPTQPVSVTESAARPRPVRPEPEPVAESAPTEVATIKRGGNLWATTRGILAKDPEAWGYDKSTSKVSLKQWLETRTANILAAKPEINRLSLTHAGDKVFLTADPDGGLPKIGFENASGYRAGVLGDPGRQVAVERLGVVPEETAAPPRALPPESTAPATEAAPRTTGAPLRQPLEPTKAEFPEEPHDMGASPVYSDEDYKYRETLSNPSEPLQTPETPVGRSLYNGAESPEVPEGSRQYTNIPRGIDGPEVSGDNQPATTPVEIIGTPQRMLMEELFGNIKGEGATDVIERYKDLRVADILEIPYQRSLSALGLSPIEKSVFNSVSQLADFEYYLSSGTTNSIPLNIPLSEYVRRVSEIAVVGEFSTLNEFFGETYVAGDKGFSFALEQRNQSITEINQYLSDLSINRPGWMTAEYAKEQRANLDRLLRAGNALDSTELNDSLTLKEYIRKLAQLREVKN